MYRKNLFGDVTAIYNGTTKVAEYVYDAWGNCTITLDKKSCGTSNPFRYRGYYFDNDLQMYYLLTRYYDPQTGRFINADTPEYLDPKTINGLNLYAYCRNNPVMHTDPYGTDISYDCNIDEGYDPEDDLLQNGGGGGGGGSAVTTTGSSYGSYGGTSYGNLVYGSYSSSNYGSYTNSRTTYGNSGFNPNQQAVLSLAKEYRNGLPLSSAQTLVDWANEYGISNHGPMTHTQRGGIWSTTTHINIRNLHIPIVEK